MYIATLLTVDTKQSYDNVGLDWIELRTVPPFVTAHTFCASRDIRVSKEFPD